MWFELTTALRFLRPNRKEFARSLLGILSFVVLTLTSWLIILFYSITEGLEKRWIDQLVQFTGHIRIYPSHHANQVRLSSMDLAREDPLPLSWIKTLENTGERPATPFLEPLYSLFKNKIYSEVFSLPTLIELNVANHQSLNRFEELFSDIASPIEGVEGWTSQQWVTLHGLDPFPSPVGKLVLPLNDEDLTVIHSALLHLPTAVQSSLVHQILDPTKLKSATWLEGPQIILEGGLEGTWVEVWVPHSLKELGVPLGAQIVVRHTLVSPFGSYETLLHGVVTRFYDPGMLPLGGRHLLTNCESIKKLIPWEDLQPFHNFIQVWNSDTNYLARLQQSLSPEGAEWIEIMSYEQLPWIQPWLMQMKSDRMLFTFLAVCVLIVAASSSTAMLLLMVHERRGEIALFQTLGMQPSRIILCFALAGVILSLSSSCLGVLLAQQTLYHLHTLLAWLSALQGAPLLSTTFYGSSLPQTMSITAIELVCLGSLAFTTLSAIIGVIPALRRSPMELIRSL